MTVVDAPADPGLAPRVCRLVGVRRQTHDVVTLDTDARDEPTFAPGQFDMVYAPGIGESAISLSSDPADPDVRSHTIRAVGWVTRALCRLRPGDPIGVRGPFGHGWPLDTAVGRDLLLVAGGIGLAPLRPAVTAALRQREKYRRVVLVVGARRPADLVFADDLAAWADDPAIDLAVTVDTADPSWHGDVGVVTRLLPPPRVDPTDAVVLTCGPEVMMRFVARSMLDHGLPPDRLHVTLERSMRCGVGTCGHCQLGPHLLCRDGPVMPWPDVAHLFDVAEL